MRSEWVTVSTEKTWTPQEEHVGLEWRFVVRGDRVEWQVRERKGTEDA